MYTEQDFTSVSPHEVRGRLSAATETAKNELLAKRDRRLAEAKALADRAAAESRELTEAEVAKFDGIRSEAATIDESIKKIESLATVSAEPAEQSRSVHAGRRVQPGTIGMDKRDVRRWSFLRAVRAALTLDWREAPFEHEVSRAAMQVSGKVPRSAHSFTIPADVLLSPERRDMTIGTPTAGGHFKATDLNAAAFIDLLRNKLVTMQAGATVFSGLVGDLDIPRQTGAATAAWVAESGAASESTPAVDKVSLSVKTVSAYLDMSRKFIQQSSVQADQFAENDLSNVLALAIDLAALHGTGASNQPTGVAATAGIGSVAIGTNGGPPTYATLIALETEVAQDNADIGTLGYITNSKVRGKLRSTVIGTDQGMCWQPDNTLLGYRAHVSNQVSSTLTKGTSSGVCSALFYGNWADLLIALWGGLDLLVDPYSQSTTGVVRVVAFQDCDIGVRHPESFSACLDLTTT